MSPTRNGVPLPYRIGIAPLNLHSRDGGLVLALIAIVIAAPTTVKYQTDAISTFTSSRRKGPTGIGASAGGGERSPS